MRHSDPIVVVASAFLLGLIVLVLAACSASRAPAASPAFMIVATDEGFEAPTQVPAGLRHIVFTNHGTEIHEAMLVKLPAGMDAPAFVAAVKGGSLFPEGALDYSGPGLTSPGETTEQWLRLDPGNYIVICWNGNHASTRRPQPLVVVAEGAHDDLTPPADVVLRLKDFRFELSASLRRGSQVLKIENDGPSMHEADIYRLLDGKTVEDLLQWRRQDGAGTPPAIALGGVLDSHDIHREIWIRRTFAPGRYVLQCEMPMSEEAKAGSNYASHTDAGMVLSFEIAK